jgi:hypothetical protein
MNFREQSADLPGGGPGGRCASLAARWRAGRWRAAVLGACAAALLTTSGVRAEVAAGDIWTLFSELNLEFIKRLVSNAPYVGTVAGWALKLVGKEIASGNSVKPDAKVLAQLQKMNERLDAFDRQLSGLSDKIDKTKLELSKSIHIAQFNLISAQLREPVSTIEGLHKEYKDKWTNKEWIKNKPVTLVSAQQEFFKRQIMEKVPPAAQRIHATLLSSGGSPGVLELWTQMTTYDLPARGEVVTREWLARAGELFSFYSAVQLKALALEAELAKSYATDTYTADDEVNQLKQSYSERFLEEIKYLPYGKQLGNSWIATLPDKTDLFVDPSTGFVWTTAKAITGKETGWLGWPDGNNAYSAPTLEPLQVWLTENQLVLPTVAEFAQAFRAFGPKASWPTKKTGDLGEFLAWYLSAAFSYTRETNVEFDDGDPIAPCLWIATPKGVQSKITTTISRSRTIKVSNTKWDTITARLEATKLDSLEGHPTVSTGGFGGFYTRRPVRECTVIAFRAKKFDGTPAHAQ